MALADILYMILAVFPPGTVIERPACASDADCQGGACVEGTCQAPRDGGAAVLPAGAGGQGALPSMIPWKGWDAAGLTPPGSLDAGLSAKLDSGLDSGTTKAATSASLDAGVSAPSCQPTNGGVEICDQLDNDCDGQIDEGFGAGEACSAGVGACQREGRQVCAPDGRSARCDAEAAPPTQEVCDGADNDCDGQIDEDVVGEGECRAGVGACERRGVATCSDGKATCSAIPGEPSPETCDGVDNDCDGQIDELVLTEACTVGEGACQKAGVQVCLSGQITCAATAGRAATELCDGIDNDCDGEVDENFPSLGGPCRRGLGLCRATGKVTCRPDGSGTTCDAVPEAPEDRERCDALDHDCDGNPYNGFAVGESCFQGMGICKVAGALHCDGGGELICDAVAKTPTPETCDQLDNDCDGRVDEELLQCEEQQPLQEIDPSPRATSSAEIDALIARAQITPGGADRLLISTRSSTLQSAFGVSVDSLDLPRRGPAKLAAGLELVAAVGGASTALAGGGRVGVQLSYLEFFAVPRLGFLLGGFGAADPGSWYAGTTSLEAGYRSETAARISIVAEAVISPAASFIRLGPAMGYSF